MPPARMSDSHAQPGAALSKRNCEVIVLSSDDEEQAGTPLRKNTSRFAAERAFKPGATPDAVRELQRQLAGAKRVRGPGPIHHLELSD